MLGFYKTAASASIDPRLLVIMGLRENNESLSKLAADDPYIAGFCKVASDHGINPSQLVKQAWFLDGVGDWVADKWHGLKRFGGNLKRTLGDLYDNASGVWHELNTNDQIPIQTKENFEDLATVGSNALLGGLAKGPGLVAGLITGLGGLISGGLKGLFTPGDSMIDSALDWGGKSMDWAREGIDHIGGRYGNLRDLQDYFDRGANMALNHYVENNNLNNDPEHMNAFDETALAGARLAKFGLGTAGEFVGMAIPGKAAKGARKAYRSLKAPRSPTPPSTPTTPPSTTVPPSTPTTPPRPPTPPAPNKHWWQHPIMTKGVSPAMNTFVLYNGFKEDFKNQNESLAANRRARQIAEMNRYNTQRNSVNRISTYYNPAPYSPQSSLRPATVQDRERARSLVNNPNKEIIEKRRRQEDAEDAQRFDELYGNH